MTSCLISADDEISGNRKPPPAVAPTAQLDAPRPNNNNLIVVYNMSIYDA
jgi:hypothetical protein